jgi:hypothetical protein
MFRFSIRDVLWLTVVAALAVGWGVDRWTGTLGRVAGRVTLDGMPLGNGWVVFENAESGRLVGAKLRSDGKFDIGQMPIGSYTIAVEHSSLPAKYSDLSRSALKAEVREGLGQFDFDLRSR